jgi:hypothetical protein
MAHCKDKFLVQTEVLPPGEVRMGVGGGDRGCVRDGQLISSKRPPNQPTYKQNEPTDDAPQEVGPDTFKRSEGTKLRVVIEGPPAPPSPVSSCVLDSGS